MMMEVLAVDVYLHGLSWLALSSGLNLRYVGHILALGVNQRKSLS
jgi:hypothetical protein